MRTAKTVVIVEDDFLIAEFLKITCSELGADVLGMASEPQEAIDLIVEKSPKFVLMDVRLGGRRDGVDVAIRTHEHLPDTKIIFVTGSNEPPTLDRINQDHPHCILIKPINPGDLEKAFNA